jgi:hypothetical protein
VKGFREAIDIFGAQSRVFVFDWLTRKHRHRYANLFGDAVRERPADHWDENLRAGTMIGQVNEGWEVGDRSKRMIVDNSPSHN